jgi:hypothetical protein
LGTQSTDRSTEIQRDLRGIWVGERGGAPSRERRRKKPRKRNEAGAARAIHISEYVAPMGGTPHISICGAQGSGVTPHATSTAYATEARAPRGVAPLARGPHSDMWRQSHMHHIKGLVE